MIQKESFCACRIRSEAQREGVLFMAAKAAVKFIFAGELAVHRQFILENSGPPVPFPAGTVLSRAAEVPARVYYLLEGMTKVYTSNTDGYIRLLGYHRADTLCVLDGLRGVMPSVVTIETIMPVWAVPLTSEDLCRLGKLSPEFALDLAFFVGDTLRLMCFDAENQSIGDVGTRLANFFLLYRTSPDYQRSGFVAMSQDNLASAVNASRVQVARVCSKMQKAGMIRTHRGKVELLNEKGLEQWAEGGAR